MGKLKDGRLNLKTCITIFQDKKFYIIFFIERNMCLLYTKFREEIGIIYEKGGL